MVYVFFRLLILFTVLAFINVAVAAAAVALSHVVIVVTAVVF